MGIFSGRHFPRDIILWAVRWYCRYGVSYRDLEEMMTERGVPVDHTTIYRWVVFCQLFVCQKSAENPATSAGFPAM
jgi:IS6 family transposase